MTQPEAPAVDLNQLTFVEPSGTMAADTRWKGFQRSTNKVFFLRYAARCTHCKVTFEARPSRLSYHFLAPKDSGSACKKADSEFLESYTALNKDHANVPKKTFYSVVEKQTIINSYKNNNNDVQIIRGLGYNKVTRKLINKWMEDLKKAESREITDTVGQNNSAILFELEVNKALADQKKESDGKTLNLKTIRKVCQDIAKSSKFSTDSYIHKLKFNSAYLTKRFKHYMKDQ
jgi:hypothetical protein